MGNSFSKYEDEFKKSLISMHQNGKSLTQLSREYGVSLSALSRWDKLFSEVKIDDMTAKQIKELQNRNALLEEENLILKKRLPYSRNTQATLRCCAQTSP